MSQISQREATDRGFFSDFQRPLGSTPSISNDENRPGQQHGRWHDWRQFLIICFQLALALLIIQQFRLESRSFFSVAALMAGGFVVHTALPFRFRQPFFAALSIASVILILGFGTGIRLVLLGTLLIVVCHLPVRFAARALLLVALGALLAAFRANEMDWLTPGSEVLAGAGWAILGSMFMFRLAVYMDALRTREPDDPPPTVARTAGFFFMAPNVVFPLFPVVDYNRFVKNYYDAPALEIYQTGVKWIARGLLHLILYRLVYTHFANDPAKLRDLGDVLRYLLATYLLYLRVSGSFHLVVGLLNLFGYHLPETHRLYFLAESFNDYWRRINIYWKDFMMKLVYYPSFFRLRKLAKGNNTTALVLATALVFVGTWALHSYQWFWLRGGFPIGLPDILFWGFLAGLVIWNAVRETKRGRNRAVSTARAGWSWSRARRVAVTFTTICIAWSLWSADSVIEWVVMWRAATFVEVADLAALAALIVAGLAVAGWQWDAPAVGATVRRPWYRRTATATTFVLISIWALGQPTVQRLFGDKGSAILASLQTTSLNAQDAARHLFGYYERLDIRARQANDLWDPIRPRPANLMTFTDTRGYRIRASFLGRDNVPSTNVIAGGVRYSINKWGMRGPEVEKAKPPATVRVAFLGPSYIFGLGVPDSATLPAWLEKRLNRETVGGATPRYEVLNFGVPGTALGQRLALLDERVFQFSPDIVVFGIDSIIPAHLTRHLTDIVRDGISIPYSGLAQLLADRGVEMAPPSGPPVPFRFARKALRAMGMQVRMPRAEIEQHVMMSDDTLTAWVLGEIARSVRAHGAIPVAAAIDLIREGPVNTSPQHVKLLGSATAAGFVVADVRDAWVGRKASDLQVTAWDDHPNVRGYELLADRLFLELSRKKVIAERHAINQ